MGGFLSLMFNNKVAVIMAGGKSSRMQTDKALLAFGADSSLAEYQHKRLSKFFSKVYVSAKENKFNFKADIIKDTYEASSPLVALLSIFETLELDEVFVLSVDAPFVEEESIQKLYEANEANLDVVLAESSFGLEPLCAIYHRSFFIEAKKSLVNNEHRLQSLLKKLKVKKVFISEEKSFMNLNYPKDYNEAKERLEKYI